MPHGLTILFLIRLLDVFVSGELSCPGSDWLLDGYKCYKTIYGSTLDGQARCINDEPKSTLMLASSFTEATTVDSLFFSEALWVGLRYRNGAEWIWDNGSNEPVTWETTPVVPQLCIGLHRAHSRLFDYYCYNSLGLICQRDPDESGSCESGWKNIGKHCFIKLRPESSGVSFSDGRILCSTQNAFIMMPQSQSEASTIATNLDLLYRCWVGVTDFDADHIYTWEDGTDISQSSLYFNSGEPDNRDQDYICAYIQNGNFYNHACTTSKRVICQIEASTTVSTTKEAVQSAHSETKGMSEQISTALTISTHLSSVVSKTSTENPVTHTPTTKNTDSATVQTTHTQEASTTVSTAKEPISSTDIETKAMSEHVSTALQVSTHLSAVVNKTSTVNSQRPTPTTKYTDAATAQTTHTQSNKIIPTTSQMEKSSCSKSSSNSCRCQKRALANTTGNQTIQTLKVTDYIWLNKCDLQPLIDAGMVDVTNCPYECKCSPKGSTNSQADMFACVRRP